MMGLIHLSENLHSSGFGAYINIFTNILFKEEESIVFSSLILNESPNRQILA